MVSKTPEGAEEQMGVLVRKGTEDLTPREIVEELGKYVIGQTAAKRAVAIALRNRMRRQKLPSELAEEAMRIAADICIYTNANVTVEEL